MKLKTMTTLSVGLTAALTLAACGKQGAENNDNMPSAAMTAPTMANPPAHQPMPASTAMNNGAMSGDNMANNGMGQDNMNANGGMAATTALNVGNIELGSAVNDQQQVTDAKSSFAPDDTIYASVSTTGNASNATMTATWTYQDGQTVSQSSKSLSTNGPQITTFHIAKPDGWPAGHYKLDIALNGKPMGHQEFDVSKQ